MQRESTIRSELLDLLPVAANRFGLKRRALDHLIWLVRHTRVMDWEPGNRAVVYKSVSDTAAERQVTARQIYNYEQDIIEAFGLRVELAYNRRRYGRRDQATGRIVTAFGFELTDLRHALPSLRQAKAEIDTENERRRDLKRRLSALRGRVRKLAVAILTLGDAEQASMAREMMEAVRGRIDEGTSISQLEARIVAADRICRDLQALMLQGKTCGGDVKISDASEKNFRPIDPLLDLQTDHRSGSSPDGDNTTRELAGAARTKARPDRLAGRRETHPRREPAPNFAGPAYVSPEEIGAHRIRPLLAVKVASFRFLAHLPPESRRPTSDDVIDAAKRLLPEIEICHAAWRHACQIVGPYPAALCVLVADRAAIERGIASPGGYLRGMIKRALSGGLAVDRSIFGLLNSKRTYHF